MDKFPESFLDCSGLFQENKFRKLPNSRTDMSSEKNITNRIRLSLNIFKSFFYLINTDIKKNRAINITALIMSLKIPR
jgi:hypothetical protein